MATGSFQLREYPGDLVRLSCDKCGRAGQYRKRNLIEHYGADIRLPDLREEISQCRRHGQMHDACVLVAPHMSAFEGKADMTFLAHMSPFDPKRTPALSFNAANGTAGSAHGLFR
jgi:hypothetical protein